MPSPELLVKFDDVIPNGAERIMAMAERQALHRQEIEKAVVIANNRDSLLGVIFAGSIGIGATFGSIWLISIGRNVTGIGMFIGAIATLAGVYIKGLQKDKKDLDEKR